MHIQSHDCHPPKKMSTHTHKYGLTQKVIISSIPRCFSLHFLFCVAWHRFRHLFILSNTKTFCGYLCESALSAPLRSLSCYAKTIYAFGILVCFLVAFSFFSLVSFFYFVFAPVDLCSFAQMHCAYYTSVVREKDRRDNCENKQCIKCSTKMLFHHIICIKQEWTNRNKKKQSLKLEKATCDAMDFENGCDSWQ